MSNRFSLLIQARVFGNSPDFRLNVRRRSDLWEAMSIPRERGRIERATPVIPGGLVIRAANSHVGWATAFCQMKRTVVLPARHVRAWPKQPDFPF
jgi:hypothetical protein